MTVFLIISLIALLVVLFILWVFRKNKKFCAEKFNDNNTITAGRKGSGKDLFTQSVISYNATKNKKTKHNYKVFSNIDYGFNSRKIKISDLTVYPNNFKNLILGQYHLINKNVDFENAQVFISDAGIYLPSQYDNFLDKHFESLPVLYATSRHLYNMNIHLNSQRFGRLWLKLREQADHYFLTLKTRKIFNWFFVKVVYYEKYESALAEKLPISKVGITNKYNRADIEKFHAENGLIKQMWVVVNKRELFYDTRVFHELFFGVPFATLSPAHYKYLVNTLLHF